jgi:hypothetical protein
MTFTQVRLISRSFRTERSRREAAQHQERKERRLVSASRRAHARAVRLMAEAFGVGAPVPPINVGLVHFWPVLRGAELAMLAGFPR